MSATTVEETFQSIPPELEEGRDMRNPMSSGGAHWHASSSLSGLNHPWEKASLTLPNILPMARGGDGAITFGVVNELPAQHAFPPPAASLQSATNSHSVHGPARQEKKRTANAHFAVMCFSLFLGGWNDSTTGPLLPTIQRTYNLNFTTVSLLFVASTVGFVAGGLSINTSCIDKLGFGKVIFIGAVIQAIGYVIQATGPPFPVFAIAFGLDAVGWGIQNAKSVAFISGLKNSSTKMGVVMACYGVGALTVPIIAGQFAKQRRWSFHYLTSLGLALVNIALIGFVLRFRTQDKLLELSGDSDGAQTITATGEARNTNRFSRMVRMKEVHIMAFWLFLYVGVEVTTGGWINTYLIVMRGAGSSAAYVVTGFWGGFTVGRVAFLWFNRKIGERCVVFIYTVCAIGLQITVWFIPSLFENAIAVALIGLVLGPLYPIAMSQAAQILPRSVLAGAISWMACIGFTGSAVLPFVTGALASKFGIGSLQPFLVSMMALMLGCWALVPKAQRRVE